MTTEIPYHAGSESTDAAPIKPESPFPLQERWRSYAHLVVHDNVEGFSVEVMILGAIVRQAILSGQSGERCLQSAGRNSAAIVGDRLQSKLSGTA
jgi:hypothetical protein